MTYANIDTNRPATFKQVQAVSYSVAKKIEKSSGLDNKLFGRLAKQVQAVLLSQTGGLTHGKVQELFKLTTVPKSIISKLEIINEPSKVSKKPAKKVTKVAKTSTKSKQAIKPEPEYVQKHIPATPAKYQSKIQKDFNSRIEALEASSAETLEKIELIQSSLETLITTIKG